MGKKTSQQNIAAGQAIHFASDTQSAREVEVIHARLRASQLLTLASENDCGTDPYNSTGQHATLGLKGKS